MIDEKKLIYYIKSQINPYGKPFEDTAYEFGLKIMDYIGNMQKSGDWIPCSERLPNKEEYLKDDGRFILDDGNRRYQGLFDIYDGKFKWAKHISGLNYELFEDNCVIAWMPLPKRYKPEEDF